MAWESDPGGFGLRLGRLTHLTSSPVALNFVKDIPVSVCRGRLKKGFDQVELMIQASSGRSGKQQQEQNPPNFVEALSRVLY